MRDTVLAARLCTLGAVRDACTAMLAIAEQGRLMHFALDEDRLADAADYTVAVIRRNYPSLDIPHHARWRHFAAGGADRWGALRSMLRSSDPVETGRVRVELCVVSVLLDAGAGAGWRYRDAATGQEFGRSEGLGIASIDAFRAGLFSADGSPRVDAGTLQALSADDLGHAFQVTAGNPLAGLDGRAAVLRRLGSAVQARADLFIGGRLGGLFDALIGPGQVQAARMVATLLDGLGPVWPSRTVLSGRALGDVWPHPASPGGFVPFHKLTQWLAYSLIEVFEDAGVPVTGTGDLTGLPEYRNGGLFIDTGVLRLRDPALAQELLPPGHPAVVEWRALTVGLLDRLAPMIRRRLDLDLPLSRILEGGTWAAGRAIARDKRPGGVPPLQIISDGTVF